MPNFLHNYSYQDKNDIDYVTMYMNNYKLINVPIRKMQLKINHLHTYKNHFENFYIVCMYCNRLLFFKYITVLITTVR